MRGKHSGVVLATVLLLAGCEPSSREWTPVLESTPPSFLEREVEQALGEVRRAREEVGSAPESAESALDRATDRLAGLSEIYLPLYRAKVEVTNAYRRHALGDDGGALRAVEAALDAAGSVNRATDGELEAELHQVVEPLADARLALEGGSEAAPYLERAAETLDDLLTRAGLLQ